MRLVPRVNETVVRVKNMQYPTVKHVQFVRGEYLHYSFAWREKYGERIRRRFPVDAFAAGFSAAATEVAIDLPPDSLAPVEEECYACRQPAYQIKLTPHILPFARCQLVPVDEAYRMQWSFNLILPKFDEFESFGWYGARS